jgi:ATP-dependent protease Clp ATPase subunit
VTATEDLTADVICTFCVKPAADIETMVAGPGVYICNECVALCVELIENKPADNMPALASWQERLSDEELLAALPKVAAASAQVDAQLTIAVRSARARGMTWTKIGDALGTTRQSAWERFSGEE